MTFGSCSGPPSVPYFRSSKRSKNSSISRHRRADRGAERRGSAAPGRARVRHRWVTSSGCSTTGAPACSTACAACGSTKMLNSADRRGVAALRPAAAHADDPRDPRHDVRRPREGHRDVGQRPERAERHRCPAGSRRRVSTMKSTAWPSRGRSAGSGRSGPSSPDLPCTSSAVTGVAHQRPRPRRHGPAPRSGRRARDLERVARGQRAAARCRRPR